MGPGQMSAPPSPAAGTPAPGKKSFFGAIGSWMRGALTRLWAKELDLGRIGMMVAPPVLAWVFYTTSSGMIDIMQKAPGDVIGLAGAFVATSAILIMLAATSWSLGADLAALIARRRMARERMIIKTLVTAVVFLFVFSISAFFSFTYYYNNIFKLSSRRIVAETQPMELAAEIALPARKQIDANYAAASARIAAEPGYRDYLNALDALVATARQAGPALRETILRNQEAQRAKIDEAARQAAAELESARAAARQMEDARAEILSLEKSAAEFDAIIRAKQAEIDALSATARQEEQLAVDAEHGLDNKGAACGPNCHAHRAKAEEALKRLAAIRKTLTGPTNERTAALRKRDALAASLIPLKQKAETAATVAGRPAARFDSAPDLDATLRELTAMRDALQTDPTWARIRDARPLCEPLLAAARQAGAAPATLPRDFVCEPQGPVRDLLAGRDTLLAARAEFDRKCGMEAGLRDDLAAIVTRIRAAPSSDTAAAANGLNAAKAAVDACVVAGKTVGLTDEDVRDFLKKSDNFLRAHSSERNKFELAREAFWSFTPDSTMAICVAMAQDAFLFIMKFLSEIFKRSFETRERRQFTAPMDLSDDEDEAVELRAMKALLRAAHPTHGDMSEIDPAHPTISTLPSNVRENLTAILNRLIRDEIAHVDRRGFSLVDNVTMAQIEARLHAALKPRSGRALRLTLDGDIEGAGPRAHYADPVAARMRRRRPSALERYLAVEDAAVDGASLSG